WNCSSLRRNWRAARCGCRTCPTSTAVWDGTCSASCAVRSRRPRKGPARCSADRKIMEPEIVQLVADLGGTNLRIARVIGDTLSDVEQYSNQQFPSLFKALKHYLELKEYRQAVLCLAVASPVQGDLIRLTNLDWQFSQRELKTALGLRELVVINDYTAIAMAVPFLSVSERRQVGDGAPLP